MSDEGPVIGLEQRGRIRCVGLTEQPHSSPHFFDGIKESGDHGGGFEKNRGVSADGRFLRIHPDDSPAPR